MKLNNEIKRYNFDNLKVGVISDSQLSHRCFKKDTYFQNNLIKALETLKNNNCNMIIFAGDICNIANKTAYNRYVNCFKKVYGDNPPLVQHIMGNHDYYPVIFGNNYYRNLFSKSLDQNPLTHYVVNGYHFIGVSPCNCSMVNAYESLLPWLENHIELAEKESSDKPIFVTTHNSPKNTVYGSDDWGDIKLGEVFSKHNRVINLSGHLHYPILDERSYYYNGYQALTTQATAYVEMEHGKLNGSKPYKAYAYPMGYILDITSDSVIAHRYDLIKGKELKADKAWTLYPYTERKLVKSTPSFSSFNANYFIDGDVTKIVFDRAQDIDIIHSYKLVFNDSLEQFYFSDFYMGEDVKERQELTLYGLNKGTYNIKIYAINSLGIISDNYIEIKDVNVNKNIKYKQVIAPDKLHDFF